MRRTTPLLSAVAAVALAGCGSAHPTTSTPPTPPRAASAFPARLPAATVVAFPARLPAATVVAYAVRQGALFTSGPRATIAGTVQSVAVTAQRRAYVSCHTGTPLASVGTLSSSLAAQYAALLESGHVSTDRSDPLDPHARSFWFVARGRVVYLDFARHVHQAPCAGTECAAALHIDSILQSLLPASAALSGFIAAHCAAA
jgi:hypothetical protein